MVAIAEQNSDVKCENPLCVLRGWNSQTKVTVGIHWLRFSVDKSKHNNLLEFLDLFYGEHETKDYGLWYYDRSDCWPIGVMINYQSREDRETITKGKISVEIQGGALDSLSFEDLELFLDGVNVFEPQITRLDVFFDDVHRVITPMKLYREVYEETAEGERVRWNFTPFHRIQPDTIGGRDGRIKDGVKFGNRGSKGSGSFLRIYDKGLESDGENNAIRWELELSGEKAQKAYNKIIGHNGDCEAMAKILSGLIGSCIDFVYRTGEKNLDRLERYEWWDYLLTLLGFAEIRRDKQTKTIAKTKKWVETQIKPSLTAIKMAFGDSEFFEWLLSLTEVDAVLSAKHKAAVEEYRQNLKMQKAKADIAGIKDFFNQRGMTFVF
ncbi:MAG: Replication initiation factor family protein [Parcubacteria group bacterium GW2011_GWA2_43_17]|nr:MAG: Replication initiation factor family protein [Parcubacteria group bacterium GW2011_GWA2_43_17]